MVATVLSLSHAGDDGVLMFGILAVAGIASALLLGLALATFARRRTRPYLFVALAIASLVARTLVGGGGATAVLAPDLHHLIEHGLDVAMAALVIGAVLYARTAEPDRGDPR